MSRFHAHPVLASTLLLSACGTAQQASSQEAQPLLADGIEVRTGGVLGIGAIEADLYAADLAQYKSAVVVSPGGKIAPKAMNGLAREIARRGHVAFVIHYLGNLAIIPTEQGKVGTFADQIARAPERIAGIPERIAGALRQLPGGVSVVGHSLGGAVLGKLIGSSDATVRHITLLGVSELVSEPAAVRVPTTLMVGSRDGLVKPQGLTNLEGKLSTQRITLPDVNHFCVISDPAAGEAERRAQDNASPLSSEECVKRVADALAL